MDAVYITGGLKVNKVKLYKEKEGEKKNKVIGRKLVR